MFMKYVIANTRISCIALVMWHLALSYDNDSTGVVQYSCPCEYSDKKQFIQTSLSRCHDNLRKAWAWEFQTWKSIKKSTNRVLAFSCLTIHTHLHITHLLSKAKAEQPDTEDSNPGGLCTVHSNRFRGGQGIQDGMESGAESWQRQ